MTRIALIVGVLAVALLFFPALRPLLMGAIRIVTAGIVALIGAILVEALGFGDESVVTIVFSGLLFLITWGLIRRRAGSATPPRASVPRVPMPTAPPLPEWTRFEHVVGWRTGRRVAVARADLERFVALADRDPEKRDLDFVLAVRRLPTLLGTCLDHCATATRAEHRVLVDETVVRIEDMAREAELRRRRLAERLQTDLRTQHRYFDGIARDPFSLP